MKNPLFNKYLILDTTLSVYLGLWNATMPLLITKQGGINDLIIYEVALTITAIFSTPIIAAEIENIDRATALKLGCFVIFITAIFRYVHLIFSYSIIILIAIDICAACSFAAIQPLLGIYPAETVESREVGSAYRIQRICSTISKVIGPLIAAALVAVFSMLSTLLASVTFCVIALITSYSIKKRLVSSKVQKHSIREKLLNILLGLHMKFVLPPERFLTIVNIALNLAVTGVLSIVVPTLIRQNHLSDSVAGFANAAFAFGIVIGLSVVTPWMSNGCRGKYLFLWGILVAALCILTTATNQEAIAASCLFIGLLSGCLAYIGLGKRTLSVPPSTRVRLIAAGIVVTQIASSVAFLSNGFIIDNYGIKALQFLYCGVAIFCAVYAICSNKVWLFLSTKNETISDFYENEYPHIAQRVFKNR